MVLHVLFLTLSCLLVEGETLIPAQQACMGFTSHRTSRHFAVCVCTARVCVVYCYARYINHFDERSAVSAK